MSDAWRAVARDLQAQLDEESGVISLTLPAGFLQVAHESRPPRAALVARLYFLPTLPGDIQVRTMREEDLWDLFGNPEITFEDPEFDEQLLVRGKIYQVRRLLHQHARDTLLELSRRVDALSLDARELRALVYAPEEPAARAVELIDRVRAVADALTGRPVRAGPYR